MRQAVINDGVSNNEELKKVVRSKGKTFHSSMSLLKRTSESIQRGHTDGKKVLESMQEDPKLHEKIFKTYTRLKNGIEVDSQDENTPRYNSKKIENSRVLVKRLMYFYGPYVMTPNGECLYQATMKTSSAQHKKFHRLKSSGTVSMSTNKLIDGSRKVVGRMQTVTVPSKFPHR